MQSFSILQMGRGSALNKRLFASFLLYYCKQTVEGLARHCIIESGSAPFDHMSHKEDDMLILLKRNVIFQSELYINTGQYNLFCNLIKMFYISRQHGIMRSQNQNQVGQQPGAYSFKIIKHAIDLVWSSSLRASTVLFVMERRYLLLCQPRVIVT